MPRKAAKELMTTCPHCNNDIVVSFVSDKKSQTKEIAAVKPTSKNLYVFGWPSFVGGADTRVAHTIKLWTQFMDVTIIPSHIGQMEQKKWVQYMTGVGCRIATLEELPDTLDGFAISVCNNKFFLEGTAARLKDRGVYIIWSNDMMWHQKGELEAIRSQIIDCVLYTSEFNKKYLQDEYLNANPNIMEHVVPNYIDPIHFPYKERNHKDLTVGRLSRADPDKYPENFPILYETMFPEAKYKIMAWSEDLKRLYDWHTFDSRWEFYDGADSSISTYTFLLDLDVFFYPLGHRFKESWGRTAVEAQLTGCPVIVPRGHHFEHTVLDGVTGFLCGDYEEYRKSCDILKDKDNRIDMGKAASEFARDKVCNADDHIKIWKEVFNAG